MTDPEEVDLKKTDQILATVSDRAGQTFEPDMEESGAPKKKKNLRTYLPIPSCNNVAPVTNLCLGRATTRSHSSQWSKKKVAVET